jgi:hypothetical protein
MRRIVIFLMLLVAPSAVAAQPPLYTYTFAVQAPYDAGSWSIWPGNGQLVTMHGKHFLLSAPQCDTGIWKPVESIPVPQVNPGLAVNALPASALADGVTLKLVTQQTHWDITTKPLFLSCE